MKILVLITGLCLLASLVASRQKTLEALKSGLKMFLNILPMLLNVLIGISIVLVLVPTSVLARLIGEQAGITGYLVAAVAGSISLIPGFVAFPLAAIMIKNGALPGIVATFITTLMMVGILTLPLEFKYFGVKTSLIRNALSFLGALVIGLVMGLLL